MSELTDKELLEAAAKVMGREIISHEGSGGAWVQSAYDHPVKLWNPLENDTDLLAYARERRVNINFDARRVDKTFGKIHWFENHGGEARAILLAGLWDGYE